jgi:predicted transcriptional regulator
MTTITFRTDKDIDRALADLGSNGQDRSQVIREAIMTAWRERHAERLRAEAEALAADPDDRKEARAVLADMESLRAW